MKQKTKKLGKMCEVACLVLIAIAILNPNISKHEKRLNK